MDAQTTIPGRRDNKYKARIKILVKELTPAAFGAQVEAEWVHPKDGPATLTDAEVERIEDRFTRPQYRKLDTLSVQYAQALARERGFASWAGRNVHAHQVPGYAAVTLSLKKTGVPPTERKARTGEFTPARNALLGLLKQGLIA